MSDDHVTFDDAARDVARTSVLKTGDFSDFLDIVIDWIWTAFLLTVDKLPVNVAGVCP